MIVRGTPRCVIKQLYYPSCYVNIQSFTLWKLLASKPEMVKTRLLIKPLRIELCIVFTYREISINGRVFFWYKLFDRTVVLGRCISITLSFEEACYGNSWTNAVRKHSMLSTLKLVIWYSLENFSGSHRKVGDYTHTHATLW